MKPKDQTAGNSSASAFLRYPCPVIRHRGCSISPSLVCLAAPEGVSPPSMPTEVGTEIQSHFHHFPLSPNHPLTTDDIGPSIALTMVVIMISPLIWGYKYGEWGKGEGCWRALKEVETEERERKVISLGHSAENYPS